MPILQIDTSRDRTYILSRVINRYCLLFNMIPNVLQERRATAPSVVGFQRLDGFAKFKTITHILIFMKQIYQIIFLLENWQD